MTPPAGFVTDGSFAPPDLARSPRVRTAEWSAWRPASARAELVTACFEVDVDTWAPEVDDIALAKLRETVSGTAIRAVGSGDLGVVSTRTADGTEIVLTGRGEARLDARATQGFFADARGPVLTSCFALCADATEASAGRSTASLCATAVADASFPAGYAAPPAPSLSMRAILAAVHHPAAASWGLVGAAVLAAGLAVATRRRPNRRRSR